ncbi:unnamed protein product [Bubo scandiacus]
MKLKSGCFLQHLHLDEVMLLVVSRKCCGTGRLFPAPGCSLKESPEHRIVLCTPAACEVPRSGLLVLYKHDNQQFIHRHTGPAFQLLDIDRDNVIDFNEFEATRFLFNIQKEELKKIFKDFDISGDEQLNYREFKLFAVFCIDKQQQKEEGDHE